MSADSELADVAPDLVSDRGVDTAGETRGEDDDLDNRLENVRSAGEEMELGRASRDSSGSPSFANRVLESSDWN